VEVETNIGRCLLKTGRPEEARAVIANVLAERPEEAPAQLIMAHILEAAKDFAGASAIWNDLRARPGLPGWMHANAVDGERRCAAAIATQKH
jgi:Tfp pilus assembly protein PilF